MGQIKVGDFVRIRGFNGRKLLVTFVESELGFSEVEKPRACQCVWFSTHDVLQRERIELSILEPWEN